MSSPPADRLIRVLLVEDHEMVADAIALALERSPDVEVVAKARTLSVALDDARRCKPDVVLLDRRLPDGDGIGAIGRFQPLGARVLVLTGEATTPMAIRVAEAGGAGLLLKSSGLDRLETAVRQVADGDAVFDPGLLSGVLAGLTGRGTAVTTPLTAREHETLQLMVEGVATGEIGERLGVARNTARNHVQRVLVKLGARSKLEAVAIARREGLID
ncbi:response regulator [Amycolatopsis suaedae]|uniref:Response regulator transcription factor n=1 Tax=Amycolatopsis suaedae TaxID=2510978 RepID=A0A4Q7J3F8_9PSEU|nr:response regulator transcription factor [Amycolatopsis suaedae]RZQ60514.1 response regulator transcription factor [Amycolatopsis suaedae]